MAIKIIIADDHQLFREGIANLLSNSDDVEILAQAENGLDAVTKARELKPDIVLMDIGMPEMNGIEACKIIRDESKDVYVLALSMHENKEYIKDVLDSGASGYILKNSTYGQLVQAIKTVALGNKFLSDKVTDIVLNDYLNDEKDDDKLNRLSEREKKVLKLYAEGRSSNEIADTLFISIKTVSTHKQNIQKKLELNSNAELVKFAIKVGLIEV